MSAPLFLALGAWALLARHRRRARRLDGGGRAAPWRPLRWRRPWSPRGSALPEAVDAMATAVRAGRSLSDAVAMAAASAPPPLRTELEEVAGAIGRGVATVTAVERWAAATSEPGAALVAAAVGLAGDAGGDVAGALGGVADTLRERRALGREIRALSAQARLSALVVAVAPAGFAALAALVDPATGAFLLTTPGGAACLVIGGSLDVAGWRWMRRITGAVR